MWVDVCRLWRQKKQCKAEEGLLVSGAWLLGENERKVGFFDWEMRGREELLGLVELWRGEESCDLWVL